MRLPARTSPSSSSSASERIEFGATSWWDGWTLKPGVHEVEQGRCVDHVSSHGLSLTGTVSAQLPAGTGTNLRSAPCWLPECPNVTQAGLHRPAKLTQSNLH